MKHGVLLFWFLFLISIKGAYVFGQKYAWTDSRSSIRTQGTLGVLWEYGNLPFYLSDAYPAQNIKVHGNATFSFGILPIRIQGEYNTLTPISGIPQMVTVSFDPHLFQKNLIDKHARDVKINHKQIDSLRAVERLDYQKLAYSDMQITQFEIRYDTLTEKLRKEGALNTDQNGALSVDEVVFHSDLFSDRDLKVIHEYNRMLAKHSELLAHIARLHSEIEQLERLNLMAAMPEKQTGELSKWEEVLSSVRALQVGRVSPNDSRYLIHGTPLNGFFSAITYRDIYVSAAHGKSIRNNIDFINTVDDNVNSAADPFYTRNRNHGGTTISSMKAGYGEKQNTHLHVGFMSGKWGDQLFPFSPDANADNQVIEVDARIKLKADHTLDLTLGRSVTQNHSELSAGSGDLFNPLENVEQNAYFIQYRGFFKKLGLKLDLDFEQRNPQFHSVGMGNLRSDRRQWRARVEQRIVRGLQLGLKYRYEHNNLFNTGLSRTSLSSLGGYAKIKPVKNLSLRIEFLPLVIKTEFLHENMKDVVFQNNLYNFVAVYSPLIGQFRPVCTMNVNHYQINQELNNQRATNISAVVNIPIKSLTFSANGSLFSSNAELSTNNYGHAGISAQYSTTKWNVTVTGNYFQSHLVSSDWGAGIAGNYSFSRFKLSAEWGKQAFGPFFLNLEDNGRSSFPYRFELGLVLTW